MNVKDIIKTQLIPDPTKDLIIDLLGNEKDALSFLEFYLSWVLSYGEINKCRIFELALLYTEKTGIIAEEEIMRRLFIVAKELDQKWTQEYPDFSLEGSFEKKVSIAINSFQRNKD